MMPTHLVRRVLLALCAGLAPLLALALGGAFLAHAAVLVLAVGIFRGTLCLGRRPAAEASAIGTRQAGTSVA